MTESFRRVSDSLAKYGAGETLPFEREDGKEMSDIIASGKENPAAAAPKSRSTLKRSFTEPEASHLSKRARHRLPDDGEDESLNTDITKQDRPTWDPQKARSALTAPLNSSYTSRKTESQQKDVYPKLPQHRRPTIESQLPWEAPIPEIERFLSKLQAIRHRLQECSRSYKKSWIDRAFWLLEDYPTPRPSAEGSTVSNSN